MNHKWQYCSLGGVVRVKISTGEDIACLGELDEKYWTVLSCPVNGLAMDRETLSCLDADSDGKIRVKEVVAAAEWLCACIKDNDFLLKGDSSISLDAFDDSDPNGPGAKLKRSARQILDNLGKEGDAIGIGDEYAFYHLPSGSFEKVFHCAVGAFAGIGRCSAPHDVAFVELFASYFRKVGHFVDFARTLFVNPLCNLFGGETGQSHVGRNDGQIVGCHSQERYFLRSIHVRSMKRETKLRKIYGISAEFRQINAMKIEN